MEETKTVTIENGIEKLSSTITAKRIGEVQDLLSQISGYIVYPELVFTEKMETILRDTIDAYTSATDTYLSVRSIINFRFGQPWPALIHSHAERAAILLNQHAQAQL